MITILKEVEGYINNTNVKSPSRESHVLALERFLTRIAKYNLRFNLKKCVFGDC